MKPIYETLKMTLAEGTNTIEQKITIPKGDRVYVRAVALPAPDVIMDISLLENGSEVHPPMDISHYNGGVGTFEQRGLQLPYNGGSQLTAKAATSANLAAGVNVEIELVFMIYTDDECY